MFLTTLIAAIMASAWGITVIVYSREVAEFIVNHL